MKRERATRGKIRNRILSLFLTMCLVVGLLPQGVVPVKADEATDAVQYYVGSTKLDMSSTAENPQIYSADLEQGGEWAWNGTDKILTFRKNGKILGAEGMTEGTVYLPAGTRIEVLGGIRTEINLGGADKAALHCAGDLEIVGGGGLWLYNALGDATEFPFWCEGTLTIGETEGKLANKRPLVYCQSTKGDVGVKVDGKTDSGNSIELVKGQLSIITSKFSIAEDAKINIANDAVLLCAGLSEDEQKLIECAGRGYGDGRVNDELYCGVKKDYYTIDYSSQGVLADYEEGKHSLTATEVGGEGQPTKQSVRIAKDDFANLYVTVAAPSGKYFVGWCDKKEAGGNIYYKNGKYPVTEAVATLYPVFANAVEIDTTKVKMDRVNSQLHLPIMHLEEAKYVITYTVSGEEQEAIYEKGDVESDEAFIIDLNKLAGDGKTASDIQKIKVKEIQTIGSGYEEQVVSTETELENLDGKLDAPTEAEFDITQATKANPNASIVKKGQTGLTAEYQYRIAGTEEWTSGEDAAATIKVGKEPVTVEIRKAPSGDSWPSDPIEITLNAVKEEKPNGKYNYKDSEITGLEPGDYTIKIGDGEEKQVTIGNDGKVSVEVPDGATEITVTKKGGEDTNDSESQTITLTQPTNVGKPDPDDAYERYEKEDGNTYVKVKDGYEYRKKTGDASEWPETWIKGEIEVEIGDDDFIQIRKCATEDAPASLPITVTKGLKITVDYETETLVGFEAGETYEITVDGKMEQVTPSGDSVAIDESYFGKTVTIVKKGKDGEADEQCEVEVDPRPGFTFDFSDLENFDDAVWGNGEERLEREYTITKAGYQYRIGETGEWKNSPATVLVTAGEKLYLRNEAAEGKFPSNSVAYEGDAKEFIPNAAVNYDTGKLTGLVANAEYAIGGMGTVVADANGEIDLEPYYGKIISIAKKGVTLENGATSLDSEPQENVEVYEKAETPSEDDFIPELDATGNWMIIKNVPNTYEFSVDGGASWKHETVDQNTEDTQEHPDWGIYVRVPVGTNVLLRRVAEAGKAPSDPITITTQEKTPNAKADYTAGKLAGLVANAQYEITVDGKKNIVTMDAAGKTDLEPYYGKTILIVKKGNGTSTTDSAAQSLTIKAKTQAPNKDQFKTETDGNKTTIKPVPNNYEYSTDGGTTWKPVENGEIKVDNGTDVLIREKGTETDPPSESVTINAAAKTTPEATPAAKADYTAGKLTGLTANTKYEITVDGKKSTVTADASGKTDLEPYYGKTISIVKKGNGTTTTDSLAQSLTIAAKTTAPSESKFDTQLNDDGNVVIKNVTSDMEYSLDDGKTWKTGTGKDLVVAVGTKVLIRVKATATTPASTPIVINTVTKVSTVTTVEKTITSANTDKDDVKGSTFSALRLKGTGKSTSVKLTWKKVKGASGYIVYGAACGQKMKKIKTIKGASKVTYTQKKLKAGKFYKYMVVAYKTVNKQKVTIATSKGVHVTTTKNAKYGNPKKVKPKVTKVTIKKGKTKTLKATYTLTKKKEKIHIAKFRYESSNKAVATVTKKGKVKGIKAGKATIYIYAQNGVYATVKVTVK